VWKTCLREKEERDPGHLPLPKNRQSTQCKRTKEFCLAWAKKLDTNYKRLYYNQDMWLEEIKEESADKNAMSVSHLTKPAESLQDAEEKKMENTVENCGND